MTSLVHTHHFTMMILLKKKFMYGEKAVTEVQVEGKLGGKRRGVAHPELPSKHRQVSEDEGVSYLSMVEDGAQPHQSP